MAIGIVAEKGSSIYCPCCRKTLVEKNFYTYKDKSKMDLCKACATLQVNNYDPDTYMWLLEKLDVPYIPRVWEKIREVEYAKDPFKVTGMTIMGKYLSQMRIIQWKDYCYADTEELQRKEDERRDSQGTDEEQVRKRIEEMEIAFERGQISEAQLNTYKAMMAPPPQIHIPDAEVVGYSENPEATLQEPSLPLNNPGFEKVDLPDVSLELTEEDKVYLAMKWGQLYTAAEWVSLENLYKQYDDSFDLHNADLLTGIIQVCKLDLKGNQALDSGDIENYSKIARASDALRKSLKLTEAQRKEAHEQDFSCYGLIVSFAEKFNDEDFIQPIDLTIPRDIVDEDLKDIKESTASIIREDPTVFKMIEEYIKRREFAEAEEELPEGEELTDDDLTEFKHDIERQLDEDGGTALFTSTSLDDEEEEEEDT